jgi:hypothetical protein
MVGIASVSWPQGMARPGLVIMKHSSSNAIISGPRKTARSHEPEGLVALSGESGGAASRLLGRVRDGVWHVAPVTG